MAASAVIGALRVDLGINSAQFTAGLKQSQANLAKFGKAITVGFAAVSAAAITAGAAMGVAVKSAIDNADAMSKAAQKVGVTTEALSRLKYAADYSDVSLEQLTGGLGRLSKSMLDVAGGSQGPAATAFKALGIAVTDASGNLRNADAVFIDIAERFARLQDGSTKTALAISLFGKSGADLIPMLNSGRQGLAAFAAESDKVGKTLSSKTGKAAENFNDTMGRVQQVMEGVVWQVAEAALPALQSFADALASPAFAEAAKGIAIPIVQAMQQIIEWIAKAQKTWEDFSDWMDRSGRPKVFPVQSRNIEDRTKPGWLERQRAAGAVVGGSFDALGGAETYGSVGDMWRGMAPVKSFVPVISGAKAASSAVNDLMAGIVDAQPKVEDFGRTISDSLSSAFSGFADAVMSGVPAVEALSDVLGNLGKQLMNSAINSFFGSLFGGGFGGGFNLPGRMPGTANLLNVGSFEGGGYTGMGSRSGGMDGRGGFPAILHPNETVVDHTAGQSTGGGDSRLLVQLDRGLVAQILQQAHADAVQVVRTTSPAAVAAAQRNRSF